MDSSNLNLTISGKIQRGDGLMDGYFDDFVGAEY